MLWWNFCEKGFQAKDDLMNHRKYEHSYTVPECIYQKESSCKFEKKNCYKHAIIKNYKQGNEKEHISQHKDITEPFNKWTAK